MTLDECLQAYLAGGRPAVPPELREEYEHAIAALPTRAGGPPSPPVAPPGGAPGLPADYEVVRELGRGGMGVVYLARQRSLNRLVAVKMLSPGGPNRAHVLARFAEEARHLAKLRHPNIVAVHETGLAGEEPWFSMDYVEGEALSARIRRGDLTTSETVAILAQVAEGVSYAHRRGIVHRDLKPANVLLGPAGRAYVTDFGLARDLTRESGLTATGDILGTPCYMAPEQANGEVARVGAATDVYAMGAILYEMLAGVAPFSGGTSAQVIARVLTQEAIPPHSLTPGIPRDLETVCLKAMSKEPEGRYATVDAFREDLARFQAGESVTARRPGLLERAARGTKRHRMAVLALAAIALVVAVVGPVWFDRSVAELIRTAEEQHVAGNHVGALQILLKAMDGTRRSQREELQAKAVRCATELGDKPEGVAAWLEIAQAGQGTPTRHGLLIARALCRQANLPAARLNIEWGTDPATRWFMARIMLEHYLLAEVGTPEERAEAQALLQKARANVANAPKRPDAADLPQGTTNELEERSKDPSLDAWDRGKAAYAAGLAREKSGERDGALDDFRRAWGDIRPIYPLYHFEDPTDNYEPRSAKLVSDIADAVRRLAPSEPDPLSGGVRFRLEGVSIPEGVEMRLQVDLIAPSATPLPREKPLTPWNDARIAPDGTAGVGVADGKYALSVSRGFWSNSGEGTSQFGWLLDFDFTGLPKVVEIKGQWIELTIPVRLRAGLQLLEPSAGAGFDAIDGRIRWKPVEGAVRYHVDLGILTPTDEPNSFQNWGKFTTTTAATELSLAPAGGLTLTQPFQSNLTSGRFLEIDVKAFDAAGRQVGMLLNPGAHYVVLRGLEGR